MSTIQEFILISLQLLCTACAEKWIAALRVDMGPMGHGLFFGCMRLAVLGSLILHWRCQLQLTSVPWPGPRSTERVSERLGMGLPLP